MKPSHILVQLPDRSIELPVTPGQLRNIEANAAAQGISSSQWLRQELLRRIEQLPARTGSDR